MKLVNIKMINWKCFKHKEVSFDRLTLLNWKNGEGKTSLIQAIVLCLFNKKPDGLDYASLVDIKKESKLTLTFTYNASVYIIEREIGKTSGYRVFKDDELIARTVTEAQKILNEIIPESVLTSLWGYEPLSVSNVLNSSYLYNILNEEFKEPLALRQYFLDERSYHQKHKSTLEKSITNQKVTQAEIDNLKAELTAIEAKIKEKAFVSDKDMITAKKAKEDFVEYQRLVNELADSVPYDRETCLRLRNYGKNKDEWASYFENVHKQLDEEKAKSSASPLTKYPKSTISALINESKSSCTCILCGNKKFHEPEINYDIVDNSKIMKLEQVLEDERYNFDDLLVSMKYWHTKKLIDAVSYSKDVDFEKILSAYNRETNELYQQYDDKKNKFAVLDKDLSKINELLEATTAYDKSKKCIGIVDEFITEEKEFYADSIVKSASEIIQRINPRYKDVFIENGVYKVRLFDKDFTKESSLAVQSLSKGEKTIVALALILSIRDLFMKGLPLIMDESFANLDANNLEAIKQIIHDDINQWIIVTHDERLL